MALITFEDIEAERNIDLTDPNGQEAATTLIKAAVAWIEKYVGYKIEQASQIHYFSDGHQVMWLPTKAPVSALTLARKSREGHADMETDQYDWAENGQIESYTYLPKGMKAVRATYTAGWTSETIPEDLRDALIDMVTLKLQAISNFSSTGESTGSGEGEGEGSSESTGGQLKKVTAGGYTEEYSTAQSDAYWKAKSSQMARSIGSDIPAPIREVVAGYRLPLAR